MRRPRSLAIRSFAVAIPETPLSSSAVSSSCSRTRLAGGLVLSATVLLFLVGCASANLTTSVPPGTDLTKLQSVYVVRHDRDGRGVNEAIRDELSKRGFSATIGTDSAPPQGVDAVVTYIDRWMWDITMYLLSLNIQFRHPETNALLVSGQSYRTSLVRKEPAEMASEILDAIFKRDK